MMVLQMFNEKMLSEENISDHERSILLVDILNAIGFSKIEREIHRHFRHLENIQGNMCIPTDALSSKITGSSSEGMCGGLHSDQSHHDYDMLITFETIKTRTPRTNNINNPSLLPLHDNKYFEACLFVEEDDNFPGYVKLVLAEVEINSSELVSCIRMIDGKLYFSNSAKSYTLDVFKFFDMKLCFPFDFHRFIDSIQINHITGPSMAGGITNLRGSITQTDAVICIHHGMWTNAANSFITRRKPHNWPSNSMVESIQSQGYDVVGVGHHDSTNSDIQWRMSFLGEQSLLLDLTNVQALCYVMIKIIIRENLNTSQREVVSSYHIKHVIFWCVELCSCQWVDSNYINCLNICLAKLIEMIKKRHIPHYILESRNLFNSKMTKTMSKEIVDVLSKYDTRHVFILDAFKQVFMFTRYNNVLLKREALISTIMACFKDCFGTFAFYMECPSGYWYLYIPHNGTKSLVKYVDILKIMKKEKGVCMQYAKYFVRSMVGFLYYVKYKESNQTNCLLASKRLIQKSLNLDNSCVKLRAATFFLANLEYSQSIDISDTFLTSPPSHKLYSLHCGYAEGIVKDVIQELLKLKTTAEIENILEEILQMFYCSVKLKPLPENYDRRQHNPVSIFRNLTNLYFHDLYSNVIFMTAEKLVVPVPIQYELLSLPQKAEYEVFPLHGISLDPMFVCLQTKFLCYHSMENTHCMAEMLTLMNSFITEDTFTTQSSYVYLNMFAYCQIKAGQHRQSVKSILQSLRNFPSRYNAASGYLKIVLQILFSLSI